MAYEQAYSQLNQLTDTALRERFARLLRQHQELYATAGPLHAFSAPGRAEIIGNHTDHNHGQVLAAAVNLDTIAIVSARADRIVRLFSDGYEAITVSLDNLAPVQALAGTTASLIRGVADGLAQRGFACGGFDAVMSSQVLSGSGLSSSAAFEVIICHIFDVLYNRSSLDFITRAQICQYAENTHFMKPSGLMDQMASSSGGLVRIDFAGSTPQVDSLQASFYDAGYALVIVNTHGSHDNLTPAYAAIPAEMRAAARAAGGQLLGDVPFEDFLAKLPAVRTQAGDRALLRALHFYQENQRVAQATAALLQGDYPAFFEAINQSGLSSQTQLQNIHVDEQVQPLTLALALARQILGSEGACRVHGGGFAGTTLNFVPLHLQAAFTQAMDALFGPGSCHSLDVRKEGPVCYF